MDVIQVKDVTKKFRIYYDKGATLKEKVIFRNRNKYEDRWVLKGINLNIKKGETVGLIGENGSGKSTLLKLLSRIIYPNSGEIKINGKVSSLLELGAGFHPDMTGKENIYMNASIFGLTKAQIDDRLNDIIAFSELEEFMDNPVRTYSSGMYMRLAFSVAINVEADILLIDEILAVGDISFQKKCFDKLKELKKEGVTIVIVTHDMGSVQRICDRAAWLNNGEIQLFGQSMNVVDKYLQYMNEKQGIKIDKKCKQIDDLNNKKEENKFDKYDSDKNRWGSQEVVIDEVQIVDGNDKKKHAFNCGDRVKIIISYTKNSDMDNYVFGIAINNSNDINCYGTNTYIDKIKINKICNRGKIEFIMDELLLVEGKYYLDVAVHNESGRAYDYRKNIYEFNVASNINDTGIARIKHEWKVIS